MKLGYKVLFGAVILVLLLKPLFSVSEADRILAQFEELRVLSELLEEEHPIERMERSQRISRYFTGRSEFLFSNAGYADVLLKSRKELLQKVLAARSYLSRLELQIESPEIHIESDKAQATLIGAALGSLKSRDDSFFDHHKIQVLLVNREGSWLIQKVVHLENLRE